MIKRTIEISTGPTYLSIKNDQLVIRREREVVGTVPCEDIGLVIVDHPAVTYTQGVLTSLACVGGVVIACGADHHPTAYVWPVHANTLHTERIRLQVESSRPASKRIWQQIVRAKIAAQAHNIRDDATAHRKLMNLCREVKSGDPANVEAQAAKVYWKALFCTVGNTRRDDGAADSGGIRDSDAGSSTARAEARGSAGFRRNREGPPPNNLLNYGYMAIRAAVARAICAAGLHPSIGFHHRNRYNAFCLADDLVEPFRPLVDARVRNLWQGGKSELDRDAKKELLGVLTEPVTVRGESGPLMVALGKMMASLVRVLEGGEKRLEVPDPCW